jgi:Family of unknown function (DUF6152)
MSKRFAAALGSLAVLVAAPSFAHHSAVMFDDAKEVTLTGTIKEFQYTNPHSWLLVDVKNDDGTVTTWGFEAEGPSTLARAGIRKSDFTPGTQITITGHPMKDGRPAAAWLHATRADGKEFDPRAGFAIK